MPDTFDNEQSPAPRLDGGSSIESYPPILTPRQAANLLQLSVSTIYSHSSQGRYRGAVKRGKPLRFHRDLLVKSFFKTRR